MRRAIESAGAPQPFRILFTLGPRPERLPWSRLSSRTSRLAFETAVRDLPRGTGQRRAMTPAKKKSSGTPSSSR